MLNKFVLIIIMVSCTHSKSKKIEQQNSNETEKEIFVNQVDHKIDSLKWLFYALNGGGEDIFFDSSINKKIRINPIECEVVLNHYDVNIDSNYYFSFVRANKKLKYAGQMNFIIGFNITDGNLHAISNSSIKFDYDNSPLMRKKYFDETESHFINYLKGYKGKIFKWLYLEAERRGIPLVGKASA
jgi:hypothetical protein